ncbi:MAG: hypothetical protein JWP69_672 [Flaviaesturariibacter sp.]|nr:hypothetical protein [Flaviaesturariibacter sp.]
MIKRCFLVLLLLIGLESSLGAQLCQGSLGDPIVNITFGAGNNPGPPLSAAAIGYQYVPTDCPSDGFYTVRNNTNICFGNTWHTVTGDRTSSPNGYFMLINASNQPSDFYVDTIRGLCSATTYEFAAWVLNVIKPSSCNGNSNKPNITFSIENLAGTVLQQYHTGNINPTDVPQWVQYGFFFTTPANASNIVVRMRNNAPGGCGNDLLLDDITFRPCGPRLTPSFLGSSSSLRDICEGEQTTVTLVADVSSGFTSPYFQWQEQLPNSNVWADIPGANTTTLIRSFATTAPVGTYGYRLTVVESTNIGSSACTIVSAPLTVRVNSKPVVTILNSGPVCEGTSVSLTASGGAQYNWSGPNGFSGTGATISIANIKRTDTGNYYLEVINTAGCRAVDSTRVGIYLRPTALVLNDTLNICKGEGEMLGASGGVSYSWLPSVGLSAANLPDPIASPAGSTRYIVIVANADGCTDTAYVQVNVLQRPTVSAGADKNLLSGQSLFLDGSVAGNDYAVAWTPHYFISDPLSLHPAVSPLKDTAYILTATSLAGCGSHSDTVRVRVFEQVRIPNVFTPNGDGINDIWSIPALSAYHNYSVLIFNRYGQQIFQSTRYDKPWDGQMNGKPLPVGTYYYVIHLKDTGARISGWVDVIR